MPVDIKDIQSMLDDALGLTPTEEQPEESVAVELTAYDPDYTAPAWEDHPDFEGVQTRMVDAGWLYGSAALEGLTVQTYRGFEGKCPIPVPPVNALYVPNLEQARALVISSQTGLKTMHVGHTGTGKTSGIEHFCSLTGRPFHRQECDQFTDDQKIFGSLELADGKTYFNKSDLTRSLAYPAVVCIDEANALPSATQMALNPLFDRRQVRVTSHDDDTTETVDAHKEWMMCATSNTNGSADNIDLYNSANVQDQAMINRLDMFVTVPYPDQDTETTIIRKLAPDMDDTDVKNLAKFSYLCHKAFENRELGTAFSIRNLMAITNLTRFMNIKEAIRVNYTNRVSESDQSYVNTQITAIW